MAKQSRKALKRGGCRLSPHRKSAKASKKGTGHGGPQQKLSQASQAKNRKTSQKSLNRGHSHTAPHNKSSAGSLAIPPTLMRDRGPSSPAENQLNLPKNGCMASHAGLKAPLAFGLLPMPSLLIPARLIRRPAACPLHFPPDSNTEPWLFPRPQR